MSVTPSPNGNGSTPRPTFGSPSEVAGAGDLGAALDDWSSIDDLAWQPSYDRASVTDFMARVATERARLEREIEVATERAAEARSSLQARTAADEERLGRVVLAAQDEIERMEREFDAAIARTRAAALEEAARILQVARTEAAAVEASADAIEGVVGSAEPASSSSDGSPLTTDPSATAERGGPGPAEGAPGVTFEAPAAALDPTSDQVDRDG